MLTKTKKKVINKRPMHLDVHFALTLFFRKEDFKKLAPCTYNFSER